VADRKGVAGAVLTTLLTALHAHAQSPAPAAEAFFANPKITEAALSPDDKNVAMVIASKTGRLVLAVMDLSGTEPRSVGGFANGDVRNVHWVNNDRLVYSAYDATEAQADVIAWPGLYAVNRDGTEPKVLVERMGEPESDLGTRLKTKVLPGNTFFYDVDRNDNSDDIFVAQIDYTSLYDFQSEQLLRLNTRTGHTQGYVRPGSSILWLIDHAGVPRVNVTQTNDVQQVYYLQGNDNWRKLAEFRLFSDTGFSPEYIGPDGTLYVAARRGRDTVALYRFDLEKNAVDAEPLISVKDYDFDEHAFGDPSIGGSQFIVNRSNKKLLGVRFQTDASSTAWFDADMKKIQKAVDAALPSTVNIVSVARGGNTEKVLVGSHSDVQPLVWYVFDTAKGKLIKLGAAHPEIDPKKMSAQEMVRYNARDGLTVPAYLTLPNGSSGKNLPLVVLVHGGPFLRGAAWGWDPEVQFLASRGYAVLQPEFRGSTGFGYKHFKAGWKQWGLAMQDDIADGARWAIAQGIADPRRICIAGASYGGYATLMGLAKDPDLYRCGVEWVGVTDIDLMYKWSWSNDMSVAARNYGMPILIGDRVKDAEQIRNTSPVNLAGKITQPLLMAYGGADRRVPIEHGKSFRDAVRPYNSKVEWVEYPEEGHGWALLKNRVDFWTRVEKFLNANIGSGRN
jgi:dipeptidyl aminopeptidase/acylaminoacyl peptidase